MEKQVTFVMEDTVSSFSYVPPMKIADLLSKFGVSFDLPCGGNHTCGKCKIKVSGEVSPLGKEERHFLSEEEQKNGVRLACFAIAEGDVSIVLEKEKLSILEEDSLTEIVADRHDGYGIAIDVGTTSVVLYLLDLFVGKTVKTASFENPQKVYGSDVLSRIDKVLLGENGVREILILELSKQISLLLDSTGIQKNDIQKMAFVGNTTMLQILLNMDIKPLITPPFSINEKLGKMKKAKEWGLPFLQDCDTFFAPCVSGYIGGDTTAALLAVDGFSSDENTLLVDVGTNGEMALVTRNKIWSCSTAAGPALEGVGISCGMRATMGAISHITVFGGTLSYTVIGNIEPKGVCGSGIVDLIAVLGMLRVIDQNGTLCTDNHPFTEYVLEENGQRVFMLPETELKITQEDIRNVQLAKAAVASGVSALLKEGQIREEQVDAVYLGGAFGNSISASSAAKIGLIPTKLSKRVIPVGNVAGKGAKQLLLQNDAQYAIIKGSEKIEDIVLNNLDGYMDSFMKEISFVEFPRI